MKYNIKYIPLVLLSFSILTSCNSNEINSETSSIESIKTEFYTHTQKIKARFVSADEQIEALFEGYINSSGNGNGLLQIGDVTHKVFIVNTQLVVELLGETYAATDIGPYFSFNQLDTDSFSNNIIVQGDKISNIKGTYNNYTYTIQYQEVDEQIPDKDIVIDKKISFEELLNTMNTINTEKGEQSSAIGSLKEATESKEEEPIQEPSFYINSPLGVTIDGKIYSLGDRMNYNDYYKSLTPEGISYDYVWDSLNKVEKQTVSYLDTTGKVSFVAIENIIFEMSTTTDFSFLGINKGISQKDLKSILGIGLSKKDLETFKPIYPDIEVISTKNSEIKCKIGSVTITFGCIDNALNYLYLSEDRGYLHYEN